MKIALENIGKIKKAEIKIDGITVIAGENNTGKSTVGKALWSIFYGLSNLKNGVKEEMESSIRSFLRGIYIVSGERLFSIERNIRFIARQLVRNINVRELSREVAFEKIKAIVDSRLGDKVREDDIVRIYQLLSPTETEVMDSVLYRIFDGEFNSDFLNIYEEYGDIELSIRDSEMHLKVVDDAIFVQNGFLGNFVEAVYIDDPFIVDDWENSLFIRNEELVAHRQRLKELFGISKKTDLVSVSVSKKTLEIVNEKIEYVCAGDVSFSDSEYSIDSNGNTVSLKSLSTGLKMFVLFKQLIQSGNIDYNGVLILDEPEIHLHPAWQIKLAEIIILLQEAYHLHILLNTHSPYFLEAIETYSEFYGRRSVCRYYLAQNTEQNKSVIREVGHIEEIYDLLANPFRILHSVRYGKR